MKRAKLSERTTPKLWASWPQRSTLASAEPTETDQTEAGNGHALAALPERLPEHRGATREDDDDDWDEGDVGAHCFCRGFAAVDVVRGSRTSVPGIAVRGSRSAARGEMIAPLLTLPATGATWATGRTGDVAP